MLALERFVRGVDALNSAIGKAVSWLALVTVIVCFATVYTRYALNTNFTWLQETYVWSHAAAIVLGAAYTMLIGGFVRVDILYGKMGPRQRAKVDLIGTIVFLMPLMVVCAIVFWAFFMNSWRADEGSQNPGGLPNWWLLISTMLVFVVLCTLQGLAHVARSLLVLVHGREEYALAAGSH